MVMSPRLLRPVASGFNPKRISGLAVWMDPADESTVTLNGSTVSEVKDKSGNNRHLVQATAAQQPTYAATLNGRKVLTGDGARFLEAAFAYTATAQTWFAVARRDSGNNTRIVTQLSGGSDIPSGTVYIPLYVPSGGVSSFTGSAVATVANTITSAAVCISRHTGSAITNRVNGVNSSAANHSLNRSFDAVRVLGHTTTSGFIGIIAEVLLYSRHLSDTEVSAVENYLKTRWGFTY
jgi:hypothetical protein